MHSCTVRIEWGGLTQKNKNEQKKTLKPLQPFLPSALPRLPLAVPSRTALCAPTPPLSPQPKLKLNAKLWEPGPARRAQPPSLRGSEPDGARQDGEGPSRRLMAVGEAASGRRRREGGGWGRLAAAPRAAGRGWSCPGGAFGPLSARVG